MHSITRRKALGGGAALLSLLVSIALALGMFTSEPSISQAFNKIKVVKTADVPEEGRYTEGPCRPNHTPESKSPIEEE